MSFEPREQTDDRVDACPERDRLQLYLFGRLDDAGVAAIEEHCSWCGSCAESLERLTEGDVLVFAMRRGTKERECSEEDEVAALIDRLRCSPPVVIGSSPASDTTLWNGEGTAPPPEWEEPTEQGFEFLAPPQAADELGRLGPYRVLAVMGFGGMGVVFRAEDPHLKRTVALKAMKRSLSAGDASRQRFLREARTLACLDHDHVVAIYHAGEDRGVLYLAMPLLKGETLDARLRREGRLPPGDALRIARETALGLAAAHGQGLVHRDVKPANIWLEGDQGRVKLLDFGLVRTMGDTANLTVNGAITGTPHYMSPEQTRGKGVTYRSDLFSLGAVLYQMLAGRPPFRGADAVAILMAVVTEAPVPLEQLDPALPRSVSALVLRLLAKSHDARPESAIAVADAIAEIEHELAVPRRRPRRRFGMVLGAVAAALMVLAGIVITIKSNLGTLVLTVNEPDVSVVVDGSHHLAIKSPRDTVDVRLAPASTRSLSRRMASRRLRASSRLSAADGSRSRRGSSRARPLTRSLPAHPGPPLLKRCRRLQPVHAPTTRALSSWSGPKTRVATRFAIWPRRSLHPGRATQSRSTATARFACPRSDSNGTA